MKKAFALALAVFSFAAPEVEAHAVQRTWPQAAAQKACLAIHSGTPIAKALDVGLSHVLATPALRAQFVAQAAAPYMTKAKIESDYLGAFYSECPAYQYTF